MSTIFLWLGRSLDDLALIASGHEADAVLEEEKSQVDRILVAAFESGDSLAPAQAESEMEIRAILNQYIQNETAASDLVTAIIGLNRTLSTMAAIAVQGTNDKRICVEASTVLTMASGHERALRSIRDFSFIERYAFTANAPDDQAS